MQTLERHAQIATIKAVTLVLLIIGMSSSFLLYLLTSVGHRGELLVFWVVGGFWLWILRDAITQWIKVRQDAREKTVASVVGKVETTFRVMPGIIPVTRYHLYVADFKFSINREIYHCIKSHGVYEVFYSRNAHAFLNAVSEHVSRPEHDLLTQREQQILRLIAAGLSNDEIAQELYISINTVKTHIKQIYRKLDVRNRADAVTHGYKLKLLSNHSFE